MQPLPLKCFKVVLALDEFLFIAELFQLCDENGLTLLAFFSKRVELCLQANVALLLDIGGTFELVKRLLYLVFLAFKFLNGFILLFNRFFALLDSRLRLRF